MFKVTILLLVVALTAQAKENLDLNVKHLLRKLDHDVDLAVTEARAAYENLITKIEEASKEATKTEHEIAAAAKQIVIKFNEIINDCVGREIADCIYKFEEKIIDVPEQEDFSSCVNNRKIVAKNLVKAGVEHANDIFNIVVKFEEEFDDCDVDKVCLADLRDKLNKNLVDIPNDIVNEYKNIISNVEPIIESIKPCGKGKVERIQSEGKIVLDDFNSCIGTL